MPALKSRAKCTELGFLLAAAFVASVPLGVGIGWGVRNTRLRWTPLTRIPEQSPTDRFVEG